MYRQETAKLRVITRSPTFRMVLTDHAKERMAEYDLARFEVEKVLKAGAVVMIDMEPSSLSDLSTEQEQNGLSFRHSPPVGNTMTLFCPYATQFFRKPTQSDRLLVAPRHGEWPAAMQTVSALRWSSSRFRQAWRS